MKDIPTEYNQLIARIEKIERHNRNLKRSLLALTACLIMFVAMGAKMGRNDGHFREITAGRITIIDSSGRQVMTIGQSEEAGTGIKVYNKEGYRVLGLGITADESGSGMLVADNDGTPRFGLGMDKGVPSIAITNEEGKKIIGIGGNNEGYGLVVMDGDEIVRAGIGIKNGNSGVALYNNQGQYVRGMVQRPDGTHFSSHADRNGNEIFTP